MDTVPIMASDMEMSIEEEIEGEADVITLQRKDESEEELSAGEDANAGSEDDLQDMTEKPLRIVYLLQSRPCVICLYLMLSFVVLASVVALIVIGVLVVVPYKKASGFVISSCLVVRTETQVSERRCSCGKGCNSGYPCIKINVVFDHFKNNSTTSAVLFENETTLKRQCSFYPACKSSHQVNKHAVLMYQQKYGNPGSVYPCLFNPTDPTQVIRTRRFLRRHVVHGLLWSSVTLLFSTLTLSALLKHRSCNFL